MERTDPVALLAWMQTGLCARSHTADSMKEPEIQPFGDQLSDMVQSETFKVVIPLQKTTAELDKSACRLTADERFQDFKAANGDATIIVDRMFVRMFEQVQAAIERGDPSMIVVQNFAECLQGWVSLTMQLLSHKVTKKMFIYLDNVAQGDSSTVVSYEACSGTILSKTFSRHFYGWEFTDQFEEAIVLSHSPYIYSPLSLLNLCLVQFVNNCNAKYKLHGHCEIDVYEHDCGMKSSFPVFCHFAQLAYSDKIKQRSMDTLYHACSGDLTILKTMIETKNPMFEKAKEPLDFYLGGLNDTAVELVRMCGDSCHKIQFDVIHTKDERDLANVADTFILTNPTKHRKGEKRLLLGGPAPVSTLRESTSEHVKINFPRPFLEVRGKAYLLSPSESMFNDSLSVFEPGTIELPGYLADIPALYKKRWHLTGGRDVNRLKVASKLLFSVATKILYAMVEVVAGNLEKIKERAWNISGLSGNGKSTSLLICQSLWHQRPDLYRVLYLPYPLLLNREKQNFAEAFKKLICYAFLRDPIQHRLFSLDFRDNDREVDRILKEIQSYLDTRNLFFVIIIDHIEEIWREEENWTSWMASAYSSVRSLLFALMSGDYNRILLITASDANCKAAPNSLSRIEYLTIDFLNGFNEREAKWMIERSIEDQFEARRIRHLTRLFGVNTLYIDFLIHGKYQMVAHEPLCPLLSDKTVKQRATNLKAAIKRRFLHFMEQDSNGYLMDMRRERLYDMLYGNLIDSFDEDKYIDKRFMTSVLFPKADSFQGRMSEERAAVWVIPMPIQDTHDYELLLCDPDFRKALGEQKLDYYILPANLLTKQALIETHQETLIQRVDLKLKYNAPGSGPFIFNDAFSLDVGLSGITSILAVPVDFSNGARTQQQPVKILVFLHIKSEHRFPFENLISRLRERGMPTGNQCLWVARIGFDSQFDFVVTQSETCFIVKTESSTSKKQVTRRLLEAAYFLGTQRDRIVPEAYRQFGAKLLFVCGINPISLLNTMIQKQKKRRTDALVSPFYKSWSNEKLVDEVRRMVSAGLLSVYVLTLEEQPKGSFEVCKHVFKRLQSIAQPSKS